MEAEQRPHVAEVKLFADAKGEWRFTAVAQNREPVSTSEGYKSKQSARDEAARLFPGAPIVEAP